MRKTISTAICLALLALFTASHCVKSYPDDPILLFATPPEKYSITVVVSGANGSFTIANGSDIFSLGEDGIHTLPKSYPSGSAYSLSVVTSPAGQECTIAGGTGTLEASINNITITCVNTGITGITQDRTYISQNPGAFTAVQITFESAYNGSYAIRDGADCATGVDYPDAGITGPLTAGVPVTVTLDATTGGSPLAVGTNTYIICAFDTGPMLQDEIYRTVEVDNTPPTITETPTAGNQSSIPSVSLNCSDALESGCNGIAYSFANVAAPATVPNPVDPSINIDGTGASPSAYGAAIALADQEVWTIEAIAVDIAGNRSAVASFSYIVDTAFSSLGPPSASEPFISSTGTKTSTTITWTSDRSNRPYSVRIGSSDCTDGTVINSGTTGAGGHTTPAIAATAFAPGTDQVYTVRVCEENFVGEAGLGTTLTVTRDETAPTITPVTGNGAYVPHNSTIVYSFDEPVDSSATVIGGGDISNEDNGGTYNGANTQLQIAPSVGTHAPGMMIWAPGSSRALDLTIFDRAGNSSTVSHAYLMRDGMVEAHYSNAPDWSYYVKNDGTNVMNASDTACAGIESNFYYSCLHGGEFRKVKVLDKIDDCTGLSAADTQSFFNWTCYDPPGAGPVEMVSVSMKPGVSLTKLLDFAGGTFLSNQVTVTGSTVPSAPASTAWWGNTIQNLPAAGGSALTAGVIYIVPTSIALAATFSVQSTNVSVVTAPNALVRSSGADPMIENPGNSFTWVSGNFDGNLTANSGISFNGTSRFNRLEDLKVWNIVGTSSDGAIELKSVSDSLLFNIRVANVTVGNGILFQDSANDTSRNIIRRASLYNNGGSGLSLQGTGGISDLIVFDSYISSNGTDGIEFQGPGTFRNSIIMNSTLVHNSGFGINLGSSGSTEAISLINLVVVNSGQNGLYITPGSGNHQIIDGAYVQNSVTEINMNSTSSAYVSGLMVVGTIPGPCLNFNTDFTDSACNAPEVTLDASLFNGSLVGSGFINHRGSADPGNSSAPSGAYSVALDWVNFNFPWRMWGISSGLAFPTFGGICNSGNCRQLDYALYTGAHQLRTRHGCPAATVPQDLVTHNWATATSGSTTFLRHAHETDTDEVWDLPFCLGNESCFVNPNIGAYQGHGVPGPSGCPGIGTGGLIENVNFQTFANNGFVSP